MTIRWHFRPARIPHRLPHPLVVSLTSYPPRFKTLPLTLKCLLTQTVKADHTILWIAHNDMPLLPKSVKSLVSWGLEIRPTDDVKSYTKILPALDNFPDGYICTADDDLYYWPTWLEELIGGLDIETKVVPCHRAHAIVTDSDGKFRPYAEWEFDTHERKISPMLFPTGCAGALYAPGTLKHDIHDRDAITNLCPKGDDIWLFWIGRRNGTTYRTIGRHRKLTPWLGSQRVSLWHDNVMNRGNDVQIQQMAERYGYPGLLPETPT